MGPWSLMPEGKPSTADRVTDSPVATDRVQDSPLPGSPPAAPSAVRPPEPASADAEEDSELPVYPVTVDRVADSPLPDNGLSSDSMDQSETQTLQQIFDRINAISDPGERADAAAQAVDMFEAAARLARKIRTGSTADLLLQRIGVTEVARRVGVSVSTVKTVRAGLRQQGLMNDEDT